MHIKYTYSGLLADISNLSGFSEIRESWWTIQWCINDAPKLDKHVLGCVETNSNIDLNLFPPQLWRLARGSLVDPLKMRWLRQLLLFCYKAELDYSDTQLSESFRHFWEVNEEVRLFSDQLSNRSIRLTNRVARLCQSVLHAGKWEDISPSHGPGASTTAKNIWENVYPTIEAVYPFSDYFSTHQFTTEGLSSDSKKHWDDCQHGADITAKLIAVPKDSRGPRLICVHPAEAIWIQQGVRRMLERAIQTDRPGDCWPRGHIHFDDQSVNGRIALLSSNSGHYSTIDLKEASDRISERLVQRLFGRFYKFFGCCRAQKVYHKGCEPRDIHFYAPMGNATVFPVQSLIFWAVCVASLEDLGKHMDVGPANQVFVFGDDLLVPSKFTPYVLDVLSDFGLLVNKDKTFFTGTFRESCGVDAYCGVDVTPLRWKMRDNPKTLESLQSCSDLAMRLRKAGYEEAAVATYTSLRTRLYRHYGIPLHLTCNEEHGGIAEYTDNELSLWEYGHIKYSHNLHRHYSALYRLEVIDHKDRSHDRNHVLESLCSLTRSGRSHVPSRHAPRRVRLKRGWTEVY